MSKHPSIQPARPGQTPPARLSLEGDGGPIPPRSMMCVGRPRGLWVVSTQEPVAWDSAALELSDIHGCPASYGPLTYLPRYLCRTHSQHGPQGLPSSPAPNFTTTVTVLMPHAPAMGSLDSPLSTVHGPVVLSGEPCSLRLAAMRWVRSLSRRPVSHALSGSPWPTVTGQSTI